MLSKALILFNVYTSFKVLKSGKDKNNTLMANSYDLKFFLPSMDPHIFVTI
jgi:hypothetical protein